MQDFGAISASLVESLGLRKAPVAISVTDDIPEGVPAHAGGAPAGCSFWEEGATRAFATSTADHSRCSIGIYTHNLAEPPESHSSELRDVLGVMAGMEYVTDADVARIPVLTDSRRHVIYAPLAEAPVAPDVVLLLVNSAQGLIVTEAVQQVSPEMPPAMGRPACAVIPQVANSGLPAMSLGCCGARVYLDGLSDDVALWALPGDKLSAYAERIARFAASNRTLTQFHELRRKDVEAGNSPTYGESMERLQDS